MEQPPEPPLLDWWVPTILFLIPLFFIIAWMTMGQILLLQLAIAVTGGSAGSCVIYLLTRGKRMWASVHRGEQAHIEALMVTAVCWIIGFGLLLVEMSEEEPIVY